MKCVILAGGSGTRFWPYSRHSRPKQLLNIIGETSMLQMTVDRLSKVKMVTDIYIITRKDLYDIIIKDIKRIKPEHVIVEPSGKNTAPAIGMMGALFSLKDPETLMGVFPADHLIVGHNQFSKTITSAVRLAKQGKNLVTIGIKPTYASTAYGYIQHDEITENGYDNAYHVKTFAEKPHKKLAERFINSGDFVWNAGIFFWKVRSFMSSMEIHMPDLTEQLIQIATKLNAKKGFDEIWDLIDPQSIDYGLLETNKDNSLINFLEKPKRNFNVSMGIYMLNKDVLKYIPNKKYFGFDDLMIKLLKLKKRIRVKNHKGYWQDIGRPSDYSLATEEFKKMKKKLLHD